MTCAVCQKSHGPDQPCPGSAPDLSSGTQLRGVGSTPAWPMTPEPSQDPLLGATVGSFRIVRKLGEGGMGSVYLGEQVFIGSKVAVKFLHEHLASNASLVQRFYAEARAVNLIGHENIVNIFDMNVVPPRRYYLIMEYLEGESLATVATRPMDPAVTVAMLVQVCDALQAAHDRGVVHRDLKPENLFLVKRGGSPFVKILDFGIAKLFSTNPAEQTSIGAIIGTPEYMAPEQGSGDVVDGRADLYAVGVIAYRMLTGRLPFTGSGLADILIAHRKHDFPPPQNFNPKVSRALAEVVDRAMAADRDKRYQKASELKAALLKALEDRPTPAIAAPPPPPAPENKAFQGSIALPGKAAVAATCLDLSRGGMFIAWDQTLPAQFGRVRVALEHPPSGPTCEADVVRLVNADQARAWSMSPGFAVQFVAPSAAFREAVQAKLSGKPSKPAGAPSWLPVNDDAEAERLLTLYQARPSANSYGLFTLPEDAEFSEIAQRGREARRELEALRDRPLSPAQRTRLDQVLDTVAKALERIATPVRRAAHDARLGNFRGVARSISAGLTVTELEAQRRQFLSEHPGAESKAHMAFVAAKAFESRGEKIPAIQEYERSLTLDPLNLQVQQRYWALKQRP